MRVIRKKTYEEASMACAELIASQIRLKPDCKIGLATGSTPVGTYKDLVDMYKAGSLDFSKVTSANLDEYRGLGGDHDQSDRSADDCIDHRDPGNDLQIVVTSPDSPRPNGMLHMSLFSFFQLCSNLSSHSASILKSRRSRTTQDCSLTAISLLFLHRHIQWVSATS